MPRKIISKYKINNFILYFSIGLISCLLIQSSLIYPLVGFIVLFIYTLFDYKKKLIIFLIISVLFISFFINYLLVNLNEDHIIEQREFRIFAIKNSYVVLTSNFHKYYVSIYDLEPGELVLNRKLLISGQLWSLDNLKPNNLYEFDFKSYLNKTGIRYQLKIDEVEYLNKGALYQLNKFYNKLFDHELSRIFILNDRNNSELIKTTNSLSLSYLFNFGGLPIFLIGYLINQGLRKLKVKQKPISLGFIVVDSLMLGFCLTINYPFLITKTFLFLLVKNIFRYKAIKINKVKLWIICFTLLISLHNEVFLNKTFYYYLVALVFVKQPKTKVVYKQVLYNLGLCSLTFMMVNIIVDYRFYYFNELFDVLLVPVFSLEAIFIYLTWWIPKIDVVYNFLLKLNTGEMNFIKKINLFYSNGYVPIYFFWLYFVSLYLCLKNWPNKKVRYGLIVLILVSVVFIFTWKYIDQSIANKFILMDVGNGQTFIYHSKHETILFDVGTGTKYSNNKIVSFLKHYGIDHVDEIFISHYHADHYSQLESLTNNEIKIGVIHKREEIDSLVKTKDLVIDIFKNHQVDKNENNNSLVYLINWNNKNILVMSDLEKEKELLLANDPRFNNLIENKTIDYMVLGHHGSKTSSCEQLLDLVNPNQALISGHDDYNRHFPDLETINNLVEKNISYKTTQEDGDIVIS